jgi:hypothetical protein
MKKKNKKNERKKNEKNKNQGFRNWPSTTRLAFMPEVLEGTCKASGQL